MVQALRRCRKEFGKVHGGIVVNIENRIIEELRKSAKIGEMQGGNPEIRQGRADYPQIFEG